MVGGRRNVGAMCDDVADLDDAPEARPTAYVGWGSWTERTTDPNELSVQTRTAAPMAARVKNSG